MFDVSGVRINACGIFQSLGVKSLGGLKIEKMTYINYVTQV